MLPNTLPGKMIKSSAVTDHGHASINQKYPCAPFLVPYALNHTQNALSLLLTQHFMIA